MEVETKPVQVAGLLDPLSAGGSSPGKSRSFSGKTKEITTEIPPHTQRRKSNQNVSGEGRTHRPLRKQHSYEVFSKEYLNAAKSSLKSEGKSGSENSLSDKENALRPDSTPSTVTLVPPEGIAVKLTDESAAQFGVVADIFGWHPDGKTLSISSEPGLPTASESNIPADTHIPASPQHSLTDHSESRQKPRTNQTAALRGVHGVALFNEPRNEDNFRMDAKGAVEAATLVQLIIHLTTTPDEDFVSNFFLTYRGFVPSLELLNLLMLRYDWTKITEHEDTYTVRTRLLQVVRRWVEVHWDDFGDQPVLLTRLKEFVDRLKAEERELSTHHQGILGQISFHLDRVDQLLEEEKRRMRLIESGHSPAPTPPMSPLLKPASLLTSTMERPPSADILPPTYEIPPSPEKENCIPLHAITVGTCDDPIPSSTTTELQLPADENTHTPLLECKEPNIPPPKNNEAESEVPVVVASPPAVPPQQTTWHPTTKRAQSDITNAPCSSTNNQQGPPGTHPTLAFYFENVEQIVSTSPSRGSSDPNPPTPATANTPTAPSPPPLAVRHTSSTTKTSSPSALATAPPSPPPLPASPKNPHHHHHSQFKRPLGMSFSFGQTKKPDTQPAILRSESQPSMPVSGNASEKTEESEGEKCEVEKADKMEQGTSSEADTDFDGEEAKKRDRVKRKPAFSSMRGTSDKPKKSSTSWLRGHQKSYSLDEVTLGAPHDDNGDVEKGIETQASASCVEISPSPLTPQSEPSTPASPGPVSADSQSAPKNKERKWRFSSIASAAAHTAQEKQHQKSVIAANAAQVAALAKEKQRQKNIVAVSAAQVAALAQEKKQKRAAVSPVLSTPAKEKTPHTVTSSQIPSSTISINTENTSEIASIQGSPRPQSAPTTATTPNSPLTSDGEGGSKWALIKGTMRKRRDGDTGKGKSSFYYDTSSSVDSLESNSEAIVAVEEAELKKQVLTMKQQKEKPRSAVVSKALGYRDDENKFATLSRALVKKFQKSVSDENVDTLLHEGGGANILLVASHETLARQISLIEHRNFQRVTVAELRTLGWTKEDTKHKARNIGRIIDRFNMTTRWVASEVLAQDTDDDRVKVLTKFIRLADACFELHNFNCGMALVLGLQSSTVSRLDKLWKGVPSHERKMLGGMCTFISPLNNFKRLRDCITELAQDGTVCAVPFIGLYLADLVFNAEIPDHIAQNESLINYHKHMVTARIIRAIICFQRNEFDFAEEPAFRSRLLSLRVLPEARLWEVSKMIKP